MKSLIIIRHAKSEWGLGLRDIDRPLKESGKSDALLVAAEVQPVFDHNALVWCSLGRRAYETAMIFADVLQIDPGQFNSMESLYTFDGDRLETLIRSAPETHDSLVIFGHNEAITHFVNNFGDLFIDNVPTCGLVKINFDSDKWASIKKGITELTIFPKDLR